MQVAGFHLAYCSNIHPGESWAEVNDALTDALPRVREQLGVKGPMGVGLRLSAAAARTLEEKEQLAAFHRFLDKGGYYVFTINGFPYGSFHGERVKEKVYLPDWRDDSRVDYSNRLASLLTALAAGRPDIQLSVSTVPGAFRSAVTSPGHAEAIADGILRHAAYLRALRERTGRTVVLAIEPEPSCFIETVEEAITFFGTHLFSAPKVAAVAEAMGVELDVSDVRQHIGLCLDTCHMAVEYEDPAKVFDQLESAGIRIGKVQVTAALHTATAEGHDALKQFADDTYLHQVVRRRADGLTRHTDLPEALQSERDADEEWRVHFHVPLFLRELGSLETTQPYVAQFLSLLQANEACRYLEVETYTWDVLPAQYRREDRCTAIARELEWVRQQLTA